MIIKAIDINSREFVIDDITELSFIQELDAPCDCLSVRFRAEEEPSELVSVRAFNGERLVFNGFVDKQTSAIGSNGFENYIYCRSSISLLVDNQAEPFTYNMPSVNQLFFTYAREFGFENRLDNIYSIDKYEVPIGASCYGAVNSFVVLMGGGRIYATPDNALSQYKESEKILMLDNFGITSFVRVINRSEPVSRIDFKRKQVSTYNVHCRSALAEKSGIIRRKYVNLASLPQWQRDNSISASMASSFDSYRFATAELEGFADIPILQRVSYGGRDNYLLVSRKFLLDSRGSRTIIRLREKTEIGESVYVD